MTPAIDFRLYLVTDRRRCAPRSLHSVVRAACDAGVRAVQLREKDLAGAEIDALVDDLQDITSRYGATLFVNQAHPTSPAAGTGRYESATPRTGLHFPESVRIARPAPGVLVGASTHSSANAIAAARAGADFVTFGPVYATPAKVTFGAPQGLERLAEATGAAGIPVFAIGGVTPQRVSACLDAGAHGVAVVGAIMAADDTAAAVRAFEKALGGL